MRRGLLFILIFCVAALAISETQTDWSGGDGVQGPVIDWGDTWYQGVGVSYQGIPGEITVLRTPKAPEEWVVNGDITEVRDAFPADVDGDGSVDIVTVAFGYGTSEVCWWDNVGGDGQSWTRRDIADFDGAVSVQAADLDGDEDVDVFVCSWSQNEFAWWENLDGSGTSWTKHVLSCPEPEEASAVFIADIDGDLDPDLVGAAHLFDRIFWWENVNGDGSLWQVGSIESGGFDGPKSIFVADVNGDTYLDVIAAADDSVNGEIAWWSNTAGDGSSWLKVDLADWFVGATSVAAADFDGDYDVDVVGTAPDGGNLLWFENLDGDGTNWIDHEIEGTLEGVTSTMTADMDADGDADVLAAAAPVSGTFYFKWYENDGGGGISGVYELANGPSFNQHASIDFADVDGDGIPDPIGTIDYHADALWWDAVEFNTGGGYLESSILDTEDEDPAWGQIYWTAGVPPDASLLVEVRASDDWTNMGEWTAVAAPGDDLSDYVPDGARYFQYRLSLDTDDPDVTPVFEDITVEWEPGAPGPLSATAFDTGGEDGIQDGDYVQLVLSESIRTDSAPDSSNIDEVLELPDGHTWLSGSGDVGVSFTTTFMLDDTLVITLSTTGGPPTVAPGDEIYVRGDVPEPIRTLDGTPFEGRVIIEGSFDPGDGPVFDPNHDYLIMLEYAQDNAITCSFLDASVVETVTLFKAEAGTQDFYEYEMTDDDNDETWELVIGAEYVPFEGIIYGISATDFEGNTSWYPADFEVGGAVFCGCHASALVLDTDLPAGGRVRDYRMVGPNFSLEDGDGSPQDQLYDDFGSYDDEVWRLFGWNPDDQVYLEYDPVADNLVLDLAAGFWLIVRDGAEEITYTDATSMAPDPELTHQEQLQPGWNLFSNPWSFNVAWEDCWTDLDQSESPITYQDGAYLFDLEVLKPGEAYWLYSEEGNVLYIPPIRDTEGPPPVPSSSVVTAPRAVGSLPGPALVEHAAIQAPSGDDGLPVIPADVRTGAGWGDPERWRLLFTLENGAAKDSYHALGVDPEARDHYDALERHDPPGLDGLPNLYFLHDGWPAQRGRYATDLREPFKEGSVWEFYARSSEAGDLSWTISNGWPAGFVALLETPGGRLVDLLAENRVTLTEAELASGLPCRVYVGTGEFVDDEFAAGDRVTLSQSFPNPSTGLIRIEYELPVSAHVEIAVYDLAGRRVATPVDSEQTSGRHAVGWDTSDVSPGVYLYRLNAGGTVITRRLVVTR